MPCSLRAFSRPSVRSRPERERRAVPSHVSARSIRSPIFTMLSSRAGAAGLKSANLVDPMPGAQRGVVGRGERRWAVPTGHAEEASVPGGGGGGAGLEENSLSSAAWCLTFIIRVVISPRKLLAKGVTSEVTLI